MIWKYNLSALKYSVCKKNAFWRRCDSACCWVMRESMREENPCLLSRIAGITLQTTSSVFIFWFCPWIWLSITTPCTSSKVSSADFITSWTNKNYLTTIILFSCLLWLSSPEILRLKFPNVGAIHWIVKLNSQKDYHYILLSLTSQSLERKKILYLLKLYKRACGNLRALCGCGVRWIQMLQRLRLSEPKQWNLSVQIKIWRLGVW